MKKIALITLSSAVLLTACQKSVPKPEPLYVPNIALAPSQVLEIAPTRSICQSSQPMQCLTVKVQGASDQNAFGIGYNSIKGFEPKTGVSYKIRAAQEIDQNTGQPTGFWQLSEVLSQY